MRVTSRLVPICLLAIACASDLALGETIVFDDASHTAYADGWQTGDNGGTGFGAWSLAYSGVSSGLFHNPQFITRLPLSGNLLGTPAFGLTTSDRDSYSDTSEARRNFNAPIGIGDTLSVDLDGSALESGGRPYTSGNTFQLFGSDGQERFGLYTSSRFNDNNWATNRGVNTGVASGSAFRVEFTLVSADTYNLAILPVGGGNPIFSRTGAALTGTANTDIMRLRFSTYGTGSSANGTKELFFGRLIVSSNTIGGDYNADGAVEAADYVVWRELDRSQDGYNDWRANFGRTTGAGSLSDVAVPEPANWMLLTIAAALGSWAARRNDRSTVYRSS